MYMHICIYTCICIYTYTHIHVYLCVYILKCFIENIKNIVKSNKMAGSILSFNPFFSKIVFKIKNKLIGKIKHNKKFGRMYKNSHHRKCECLIYICIYSKINISYKEVCFLQYKHF